MKRNFFVDVSATLALFITAVILCINALSLPVPVFAASPAGMKIVLDAGHGGMDGGVTGLKTGVKESDLNLQITFAIKAELEEMGFEVVLTRKTAAGLYGTTAKGFKRRDMQARKAVIQEAKPDLVLSIHQNRYPAHSTRGGQVFFDGEHEGSKLLAETLQGSLNALYKTQGARERTVMKGEYYILACAPVPSVIIECGFLSNAADEALLVSPEWQKKIAGSVASGLMQYFSLSSS